MILKKKPKSLPYIKIKQFQPKRIENYIFSKKKKEQKLIKSNSVPKINPINLNCKMNCQKTNSIFNEPLNSIYSFLFPKKNNIPENNNIKTMHLQINPKSKYKYTLDNQTVNDFNQNKSQNKLLSSFLNDLPINLKKNIYRKKNPMKKKQNGNDDNLKTNDKKKFKLRGNVFKISKNILFEREILYLSVYDDFNNYKEEKEIENSPKKFVSNLEKTLINEKNSIENNNYVYEDHEEEKKDTIETVFLNSKIAYYKNRLTKKNCEIKNNILNNQKNIDQNFFKKIILRRRQKFNGCEQKNKNFISLIAKRRKLMNYINPNKNNSDIYSKSDDSFNILKKLNEYNNTLFRKKRIKKIIDEEKDIKKGLRTLDEKFNLYVNNAKNIFQENEDI